MMFYAPHAMNLGLHLQMRRLDLRAVTLIAWVSGDCIRHELESSHSAISLPVRTPRGILGPR